ncbi:MAG: malonyl-CoA decarboxylase family protein [Gammaproteobacteria bacterium]|nr:malonyl-CoA decarboxylase family protein [Gammaproteobacteria bacterium]
MNGVRWFERIMNTVADRGRELLGLAEGSAEGSLSSLCRRLIGGRGEASNVALAREILQRFALLDDAGREAFFLALADDFAPDPIEIRAAAAGYDSNDPATLARLIAAVEPPRQELLRRLNMAPHGTADLVEMRACLLDRLTAHPRLSTVDADFRHLLSSWFNRGFLRLQRIDWHSPAVVLERLMHHEAVHPMKGWDDLRRRLAADRRCFGFFHPALPDEPLIFVEVALTRDVAADVTSLLDPTAPVADPEHATTAVFYSINNALEGLRGISFGNLLLKQVLSELAAELPALDHFVTLSPMPRFAQGLAELLDGELDGWPLERLERLLEEHRDALHELIEAPSAVDAVRTLLRQPERAGHPPRAVMTRLALLYLSRMRNARGGCYDPVAAFHLANGAVLERINPCADLSDRGIAQSHGVMVNYRYDPDRVEANHEAFVQDGRVVLSKSLQREFDRYLADKS